MYGRFRITALFYLAVVAITAVGFWSLMNEFNQFDAGMQAARSGDYQGAMARWLPLAEKGHPEAQYNLGVLHEEGRGGAVDLAAAAAWYRKAADQGMAIAQVNLGFLYKNGKGVERNLRTAEQWFRKAADQGNSRAQNNLGNMYLQGIGVEQNDQLAAEWFRRASLQDNHRAQYRLGMLYLLGRGVQRNPIEAYVLLALAASADDSIGSSARDTLQEITSSLTQRQLDLAAKRKKELLETITEKTVSSSH